MVGSSSSSSIVEELRPQVFINFRGKELCSGFISHLVTALESNNINIFIDKYEVKGRELEELLKRIDKSRIALAILSMNYTESDWCLRELAMIKDCVDKGKLVAIPIFYKLDPSTVEGLRGDFGDAFRDLKESDKLKKKEWKKALKWIPSLIGITVKEGSDESEKVNEIVKAVKTVLNKISLEGSQNGAVDHSANSNAGTSSGGEMHKTFGNKQRLKELEEKLDLDKYKGTRIIGVVGMPGIGKTTLLKEFYKKWEHTFNRQAFIDKIHEKFKIFRLGVTTFLLEKLLPDLNNPQVDDLKLLKRKVLVALDDVTTREQIYGLLGEYDLPTKPDWIEDGSKIIIATNDMSLLKGLVHDTYVVRHLNHEDGLQLFCYHAFGDNQSLSSKADFTKLSDDFVHYARGHPLALQTLGKELYEKNMKHGEDKLKILAQSSSTCCIEEVLKVSYNELSLEQQDTFRDIACFRSQDVDRRKFTGFV